MEDKRITNKDLLKKIDNLSNNVENFILKDNQNDFYEIASKTNKERKKEERYNSLKLDNQAREEYAMFCCWCRAFRDGDFSEKNFKEYQIKERTDFDFWLKKRIAELFFGYKFEFNLDTMKWRKTKEG